MSACVWQACACAATSTRAVSGSSSRNGVSPARSLQMAHDRLLAASSLISEVISPASIMRDLLAAKAARGPPAPACLAATSAASCSVLVNVFETCGGGSFVRVLERSQPIEQLNPILPPQPRGADKIGVRPNALQHDPGLLQRAASFAQRPMPPVGNWQSAHRLPAIRDHADSGWWPRNRPESPRRSGPDRTARRPGRNSNSAGWRPRSASAARLAGR